MRDNDPDLNFIFMVFFASGVLLFLSTGYLKLELGKSSLIEETAFTIAGTAIPVVLVGLFLGAFWFYLFAKIFLSSNRHRLHRLLTNLDTLCNRFDELLQAGIIENIVPYYKKLRLTRILLIASKIKYSLISPGLIDPLAEDIEGISYAGKRIFGVAGMLLGLSLLLLYRLVSTVPMAILSYKALIFLICSYWCGNKIGYYVAQYAHKIFSVKRLG